VVSLSADPPPAGTPAARSPSERRRADDHRAVVSWSAPATISAALALPPSTSTTSGRPPYRWGSRSTKRRSACGPRPACARDRLAGVEEQVGHGHALVEQPAEVAAQVERHRARA
jgi:hypothetical protein